VQFVIQRDTSRYFRFASLQSSFGQEVLKRHGLDTNALHSIILLEGDTIYQRSDAALRIAVRLKGFSFFKLFRVVPRFLRDGIYNLISRSRYRVFGKRNECMIPTPELRDRFVD
jgi:predicted DCC family thiol-disulfide oxidoreductase YuxK